MLYNSEIRLFLAGSAVICLPGIFWMYRISPACAIVGGVCLLFLILFYFFFTLWRYGEIRKLSAKLRNICMGDYSLDVRDNREGELSILKNDIYKVTTMLTNDRQEMESEKNKLSDALSDISHQLKTPLTSMGLMTELLGREKIEDKKRQQFAVSLNAQIERIQWLVASLLKLAKIDAGTVQFKKDSIQADRLIERVMDPFLIQMDLKEIAFSVTGADGICFTGDFCWIAEAVGNILKNCVENTPQGGQIAVRCEENPLFCAIEIKDSGAGIEKEDLPYIFQRFYKGKNAGEDSVGIGLSLSKTIIMAQGGDITAESEKGTGSTFLIKLYKQVI